MAFKCNTFSRIAILFFKYYYVRLHGCRLSMQVVTAIAHVPCVDSLCVRRGLAGPHPTQHRAGGDAVQVVYLVHTPTQHRAGGGAVQVVYLVHPPPHTHNIMQEMLRRLCRYPQSSWWMCWRRWCCRCGRGGVGGVGVQNAPRLPGGNKRQATRAK